MTDIQWWFENRKAQLTEDMAEAGEAGNEHKVNLIVARYCELGEFRKALRQYGLWEDETQ